MPKCWLTPKSWLLLGDLDCWLKKVRPGQSRLLHLDQSEISPFPSFCTFSQDFDSKMMKNEANKFWLIPKYWLT